jgi:magnesium transporter
MLATRSIIHMDVFRPSIVRVHELPTASTACRPLYAPALSFPQYITVQQAIDALRQTNDDSIYYLFVTDYENHLVGVVDIRQLVTASPDAQLFEVMDKRKITLPPDASLEEQAHVMCTSGLMALPVVDEAGRLVGAMDTTDLIGAVKDEATRQIYQLAGIGQHDDLTHSVWHSIWHRMGWVIANLVSILFIGWVVSLFYETITHVVMLAVLIPLVVGTSRGGGMQTLSLVVRSMALGTIRDVRYQHIIRHEGIVGMVNGLIAGLLGGGVMWLWQQQLALAVVAGVALCGTFFVAAIVGVVMPFLLRSLHVNPSYGASFLVITISNACGIMLCMGLGSLALQAGYL